MKLAKEEFPEPRLGGSAEVFRRSLEFQKDLFHSQVDQLRTIVVAQCKLTGVNPLSQEMAAGALSVKIGKRPRDLLNPKAVKYMQSVFSIKDAVSKKECREISALFGLTVTQVREYFASQRTRVRKIIRLSRENAIRSTELLGYQDEIPMISDSLAEFNPVPLNMIEPSIGEQTPSCSTEENVLSGVADLEKQFVDSIFSLMRKEETFSGQVKLMEWILQIQNPAVLCWFLSKGGTMILSTWLSQAATEEQTSVLLIILQVLCHLPLSKALPVHMSAILQSVNRLRFYKTSDISNRARVLLSKWSRSLARSQALKNPKGANSSIDEEHQLILKQSLNDVLGDESWQSNIDTSENIYDASDSFRKFEPTYVHRLMPASAEDSVKKNNLGVSTQIKERRKVQLVEQPGQKSAGRSPQATKTSVSNQSRPMSADDIQKAKIRAQFMQSKYRKHIETNENEKMKTENIPSKPSMSQVGILPMEPKTTVRPHEQNRALPVPIKRSNATESPLDMKPIIELKELLLENCRKVQISWKIPPEVELKQSWRVGAGESSKEADSQRNRNRREKETFYHKIQDIPLNPKDPWDTEIDYDDTLTPVIPEEQGPEVECPESPGATNHNFSIVQTENGSNSASQDGNPNPAAAEPDLELLAVLLKNPELVFALTSGQASNLSSLDTVKLLDMIKAGGVSKPTEEKVEVSLPSPTPPSNPGTSRWRPEAVRNPFSQLHRPAAGISAAAAVTLSGPTQPAVMQYSPPQAVHKNYSPMGHLTYVQQTSLHSSVNNIKPANTPSAINWFYSEESQRFRNTAPYLPPPAYSNHVGKPSSEFWRVCQNLPPNYSSHPTLTQNTSYNSTAHVPGPHWEGNEYAEGEDFESWGPHNSPGNIAGSRPEETRFREFSNSDYREHESRDRHGNRRWRDRRP